MDKILLISKRELQSYFTTWGGYIIVFAALLINGLLFNVFAIGDSPKYSSDVLMDFFFFSSGISMVAAIFLAMRLLAEERQTGTIVLFHTSPVTERELVYGKFFSAFCVFVILLALTLHLPSLIFIEGKISIGHMSAGYLGVTLLGSAVLSIALFASVVSPNQTIAAVIGAAITVILLLLWMVATRVDEPFSSIFSYASLHNLRFRPFSRGIVHIKDIVYYLSLVVFFSGMLRQSLRNTEVTRLMSSKAAKLRLPLISCGLVSHLLAIRYFENYEFYWPLIGLGFALALISILLSYRLKSQTKRQGFIKESQSWTQGLIWQLMILFGMGFYHLYAFTSVSTGDPSFLSKFSLVLWLSCTVLGLFYAVGVELSLKDSGRGDMAEPLRVRVAGSRWLGIGLFLGFLLSLNYFAAKKDKAFDWSYFKTTEPGEATINIASSLSEKVEVGAFFTRDSEVGSYVRQYLSGVSRLSSLLEVGYYDKDFSPVQSESFRASRNGQIVLMKGSSRQRIEIGDSLDAARQKLRDLDGEFQKALLALVADKKNIYFTRGQGEMDWRGSEPDSWRSARNLERILSAQNYRLRDLPMTSGLYVDIPEEVDVLAIVGPSYGFAKAHVDMIKAYVEQGGKLFVSLDVEFAGEEQDAFDWDEDHLTIWLSSLGLSFKRDMLANDRTFLRLSRRDDDHGFIATNNFSSHEAVSSLGRQDDRMGILLYQAGYFEVDDDASDWRVTPTIRTLNTTFNDINGNFLFDEELGESRQAYIISAAVELGEGRIFAVSDSTMLSDPLLRNPGNQLLIADLMRWLLGDMHLAGMTESEEDVKIHHSKARELFVFHGSIYVVPLLVLLAGFLATRRKKGASA